MYVSERITNIQEIEDLIRWAKTVTSAIEKEREKESPSAEQLTGLWSELVETIKKISEFEFCVDRRKTY